MVIHCCFNWSGMATVRNASAVPATSASRPRSRDPAGSMRSNCRKWTIVTAPSTTGTTPTTVS